MKLTTTGNCVRERLVKSMVGVTGFEPATYTSRTGHAAFIMVSLQ
jgi:hypothetical protein